MNLNNNETSIALTLLMFTGGCFLFFLAWSFQALEDAFLAIDSRMTTEEVIKELVQIAGRPTEEPPSEKVAEEDDCEYSDNNNMTVVMF